MKTETASNNNFLFVSPKKSYTNFGKYDKTSLTDKAAFDLVTSTDHVESENSDNFVSAYDSEELTCATSVAIYGTEYELKEGFFFVTTEPVICFEIGDSFYNVITK